MNIIQLFDSLLKNHEIEAFQKEYYERRKMNHINYKLLKTIMDEGGKCFTNGCKAKNYCYVWSNVAFWTAVRKNPVFIVIDWLKAIKFKDILLLCHCVVIQNHPFI